MVDLTPTTLQEAGIISLLTDSYLDASEALTEAVIDGNMEVIQLRYLSLVAAVEALLSTAGKERTEC